MLRKLSTLCSSTPIMLEKFSFSVDPKNIGHQSLGAYRASLLGRMEDLVGRMRWRIFHAKQKLKKKKMNQAAEDSKENYGFRTAKGAPPDKALKGFKEELFGLLGRLEVRTNPKRSKQ